MTQHLEPVFTREAQRHPFVASVSTSPSGRWYSPESITVKEYPIVLHLSNPWVLAFSTPKLELIFRDTVLGTPGNAKWELLHEVENLRWLEDNFNGYGSVAPNRRSIDLASQVVLSATDIRPTRVLASAQGGVAVYFVRGNRHGDIECFNSGELVATISDDEDLPRVWEVQAGKIENAIRTISAFLER